MPLTLELPPQIEEELAQEAQQEGVSVTEHTTLLVYLSLALREQQEQTPFQNAVKLFFSTHSLDIKHVSSVFELLVRQCLDPAAADTPESISIPQVFSSTAPASAEENLRAWRNWLVHQPVPSEQLHALFETAQPTPTSGKKGKHTKEPHRRPSAMGKYSAIPGTSDDFAGGKQDEIAHEDRRRD